jgi:hypothetical protein
MGRAFLVLGARCSGSRGVAFGGFGAHGDMTRHPAQPSQ